MRAGWSMAVGLALLATPAYAIPHYVLPVDCTPNQDCFIQNHVDHNEEAGFRDYACGSLGYDGHNGTDFRVPSTAMLEGEGVNILAAADGTVTDVRHAVKLGEGADHPLLQLIRGHLPENNCGEGIRIDHVTGWRTHYCHMRADSLTVKVGDEVKAGQVIGKMGDTGRSAFPHLHFEVRHYGKVIDPFVGHSLPYACEADKRYSLWVPEVAAQLPYRPAGVMAAGFTQGTPRIKTVRHEGATPPAVLQAGDVLAVWADVFGLRKDDALHLTVTAPDGSKIARRAWLQEVDAAIQLLTLEAPAQAEWPHGVYHAELTVSRKQEPLLTHEWKLDWQKSE